MQITVDNCITIRGAPVPLILAVTKVLTMDNPEYIKRLKRRKGTWGVPKKLELYTRQGNDLYLPRGFLDELWNIFFQLGYAQFSMEKNFIEGLAASFGPWNPDFNLWPDQQEAVLNVLSHNDGVLISPAGSGKTVMGLYVVYMRGRCALWLTHTVDLMQQTEEKARKLLGGVGEIGLLGGGIRRWGSGKLIIGMVDTLNENPDIVEALKPVVGTVIIDEAHHFPAQSFIDVAGKFAAKYFYGVTATPDRKDGLEKYLYVGVGPERHRVDRDILYKTGRLIKPEIKFVYTNYSKEAAVNEELQNVDSGGEELDYTAELQALLTDEERLELVARKIVEETRPKSDEQAGRRYSLVLCESVRYCFQLRDKVEEIYMAELLPHRPPFRMAVVHGGISKYTWKVAKNEMEALAAVSLGLARKYKYDKKARRYKIEVAKYTDEEMESWQVTPAQRRNIMQRMAERKIDILFATQLAREGLDIPHLNVLHLATPKRGDNNTAGRTDGANVEQEVGRVQRPDPENPNKKAKVVDYVDFNVGVFQQQYYSRRRVYKRLGFKVPPKPRTRKDDIEEFLKNMPY